MDGNDTLIGWGGDDHIYGGDGDDTLKGGAGSDTMRGGNGFDTYYADNGDIIVDSDGSGNVNIGGLIFSGNGYNAYTVPGTPNLNGAEGNVSIGLYIDNFIYCLRNSVRNSKIW